ncbi:unnamed protein product, partial [Diplocarpon coronariae]
MNVDAGTMAPT